jgi:hypothetical protein
MPAEASRLPYQHFLPKAEKADVLLRVVLAIVPLAYLKEYRKAQLQQELSQLRRLVQGSEAATSPPNDILTTHEASRSLHSTNVGNRSPLSSHTEIASQGRSQGFYNVDNHTSTYPALVEHASTVSQSLAGFELDAGKIDDCFTL